ncbi:MAG: hypothetical protein NE328_20480 [Lentisphaeraceae bacterium]|nr:hypothetical protein [Lentisphaeraceae bacterium]
MCLFLWGAIKYFQTSNAFSISSDVTLTKGKVMKKFYSGGDPRIDGMPTLKLKFTLENEVHEVIKAVEQDLFFEYDEGEEIDLFISNSTSLQVYPLKSIQSKKIAS